MNPFQSLNAGIVAGTMALLLAGLAKVDRPVSDWPLTVGLFAAFIVFARLKFWGDDHKYFGTTSTSNRFFKLGFVVGFVSWLFWAFGALSISRIQDAYLLCGTAIVISTLWIIIVALKSGTYKEQRYWLFTNVLIVALLWAAYHRGRPEGDYLTWTFIGGAILIVLVDFFISDSVPEVADAATR